jgi:hypothetical protein
MPWYESQLADHRCVAGLSKQRGLIKALSQDKIKKGKDNSELGETLKRVMISAPRKPFSLSALLATPRGIARRSGSGQR